MSDNLESVVRATVEGMKGQLFQKIETIINNKMVAFQESIVSQQKQILDLQGETMNNMKRDGNKFNGKDNEDQYRVNLKLNGVIGESRTELDEGMKLVKERQKQLMLVDRSAGGKINNVKSKNRFNPINTVARASTSGNHNITAGKSGQMGRNKGTRGCLSRQDTTQIQISKFIPGLIDRESPKGRLRQCFEFWSNITDNSYILNLIKFGYNIPFSSLPDPGCLNNNKSALNNSDFVSKEVSKLLDKKCIRVAEYRPRVVNPLTVVNGEKMRLVLDCRHINEHIAKFPFRYEEFRVAKDMIKLNDFVFSFDLRSAYHHIEINERFHEYLGFQWENKYYCFTVLPFGISSAGFIFTKLCRVLIKHWRAKGHRIIMYLDDGIGMQSNFENAKNVANLIKRDLDSAGFLLANEKCNWIPTQEVDWLGWRWNTVSNSVKISDRRVKKYIRVFI